MAFTVGWPGGESAVSVEYADGYFADRGTAAWAGDVSLKRGALIRATDYVRALFARRLDPAIFALVAPDLPSAFLRAVCEYALVELRTPGGLAPAPQIDASGYGVVRTRKKVGPIESQFTVVGGDTARRQVRRLFPVPDALIASLLLPSLGLTRTTR